MNRKSKKVNQEKNKGAINRKMFSAGLPLSVILASKITNKADVYAQL